MTTPSEIRKLAEQQAAAEGGPSEDSALLIAYGSVDAALFQAWSEVSEALPIAGVLSVSALDELGDQVDLGDSRSIATAGRLRVLVTKKNSTTTAFFFTAKGVGALLKEPEAAARIKQIWVAQEFAPIRTEGGRIDPWGDDSAVVTSTEDAIAPDPRRLVKEFSGNAVPMSVNPYLLSGAEPEASAVFAVWKEFATKKLLLCLVNEVWGLKSEQVVLSGIRSKRIESGLDAPYSEALFRAATEACRWIYASGRDVDVRFLLFTYELAREWPEEVSLKDGFSERGPRALEAAKTAFQAHVRETSKDTLKSLSDLRKTLSEEVTKVVTQTRDLLGTMWRDFMVAATAFLGRIALLGSDKPLANPTPLRFLLMGAAVFLCFSLFVTLRSNAEFARIASASRAEWKIKLFGFLGDEDFKKLSDKPLKDASDEYGRVVRWVVFAYVVVFVLLVVAAATTSPVSAAKSGREVTPAESAASVTLSGTASSASGSVRRTESVSAPKPRSSQPTALAAASSSSSSLPGIEKKASHTVSP